jgi:phosphoglycolate phosphatase-like HAD superfamily hydrolase
MRVYEKEIENPIKKLVIAWDLDGTLLDSSHRVSFKENGDFDLEAWIANCTKEKIFKDSFLPLINVFREYQKTGFTQICVTAREMTEFDFEFLKYHDMNFEMILHRKNEHELDEVLKHKKLQSFFKDSGRIPFQAYDDKNENLEVFDKYGFRTFQASYLNEVMKKNSYSEINFKPGEF